MSSSLLTDRMQSRSNRCMTDLDVKVSENCSDYSHFKVLETQLKEMVAECGEECSESNCFLRLAQATITELGKDGRATHQADVLACWLIFFYYRIKKSFPDVGKMVEMLHLHFDLLNPSSTTDVRVRNICMLLSIMCQFMCTKKEELKTLFTDKLATFLVRVILNNKSNYTLLYALMCFGPFSVVDKLRPYMSKQEYLKLNLEQLSSNIVKFNLDSVYKLDQAYVLRFRIGECAQWLLDYLFGAGSLPIEESPIKLLTSKKFDCLLQITRDSYTAFGFDHLYQNYQCSEGIDPQSGDVFCYEAILLTQGSFHVGWTWKSDNEGKYGLKDIKESIAFETYEKRIKVHRVKEYYLDLPSIKPCDVVGCLLDTSAGTFKFYLNGFKIPHTWTLPEYKLKFSSEPFHPTACLSAYQQVFFNVIDTNEKDVKVEEPLFNFASLVTDRGVYLHSLAESSIGAQKGNLTRKDLNLILADDSDIDSGIGNYKEKEHPNILNIIMVGEPECGKSTLLQLVTNEIRFIPPDYNRSLEMQPFLFEYTVRDRQQLVRITVLPGRPFPPHALPADLHIDALLIMYYNNQSFARVPHWYQSYMNRVNIANTGILRSYSADNNDFNLLFLPDFAHAAIFQNMGHPFEWIHRDMTQQDSILAFQRILTAILPD